MVSTVLEGSKGEGWRRFVAMLRDVATPSSVSGVDNRANKRTLPLGYTFQETRALLWRVFKNLPLNLVARSSSKGCQNVHGLIGGGGCEARLAILSSLQGQWLVFQGRLDSG